MRKWSGSAEVQIDDATGALLVQTSGLPGTLQAGSGQKLTCTADKTDYTITVVAGATYRLYAVDGRIHVGVAAVAAAGAIVDAAVLLTVPPGSWESFVVPAGVTSLHYATDSGAGVTGRIAQIA
jgi:hypothetical protein